MNKDYSLSTLYASGKMEFDRKPHFGRKNPKLRNSYNFRETKNLSILNKPENLLRTSLPSISSPTEKYSNMLDLSKLSFDHIKRNRHKVQIGNIEPEDISVLT